MNIKVIVSKLSLLLLFLLSPTVASSAAAEVLKPYVLGDTPPGGLRQVAQQIELALMREGFQVVGSYAPYEHAMVICATNEELKTAAAGAKYGGFGAAQRVGVTEVSGKIQVSYVNPTYLGVAYGMGRLEGVAAKMKKALGARQTFGSAKGILATKLGPGQWHYGPFMPYFNNVDYFKAFDSYEAAVATVEGNLAKGAGGTKRVYRIDLPGKKETVFGVAIPKGDGVDAGNRDTDREIMDVIDHQELRHTAYLPYEILVTGERVISLPARYRIALHFPDTPMMGDHGFTKIMSSPFGIMTALEKLAGLDRF